MPARPIVMAGGGTGGHVFPLLAVARELRGRGREVVFFGTASGIEARLTSEAGFPMEPIAIGGLKRVGWRKMLSTLWQLPIASLGVWRWMGRRKPGVLLSMGGFVSGPPMLAAVARRIPVVVLEPNAMPGWTNRRIAPFLTRALVSFAEAARYFPKGRTEITGLPVRHEFFEIAPRAAGARFSILVTGGSQGSRRLNEAAAASWPLFREAGLAPRFVLQAGRAITPELRAAFAASGLEGEVAEFLTDMPGAFAGADVIICRAGAGAVAELCAAGKPAILVPFPFAADDHQTRNAEAMVRQGAALLCADKDFDGRALFTRVSEWMRQPETPKRMAAAARALGKPDAARRAAEIVEKMAAGAESH